MKEIRLLIIEDEDTQIQMYEDTINQINKKSEIPFAHSVFKTYQEGKEALKTPFYDAVIIDLKLSGSDELEGKLLVQDVYQKIRIPIVVYSGSIAQIDDIKESALLLKRLRTEKLTEILEEIRKIYDTGLTSFLKPSGSVDEKLTQIFWNHLATDIGVWIAHKNPKTLLRYILSHFHEYLDINLEGDFEEYHPSEVYIKPPIKKNLHTGDIVLYEDNLYLVMTPACDLVIRGYREEENIKVPLRKAENVVLVRIKDFDYKTLCINKKNGNVDKNKVRNFVTNSSYRYHYLPPYLNAEGFIVDFQELLSLSINICEELGRIATISTPFIKDIIARFSLYYARQGEPTFNQDLIIEELSRSV